MGPSGAPSISGSNTMTTSWHGLEAMRERPRSPLDESASYWQKRCHKFPEDAKARNSWGVALRKSGRWAEAITHFRASIRIDPQLGLAYQNLGVTLRKSSDLEGAIEVYNSFLKLQPNDAVTWYNLGFTLHEAGKLLEATVAFEHAVKCNPKYVAAFNNLGVVLRKLNDHNGAACAYRQALEIDPNDSTAHRNLAVVLDEAGDYAAAQSELQSAMVHSPSPDPYLFNDLGVILQNKGDHVGAARALTEGIALGHDVSNARHYTDNAFNMHENLRYTFQAQGDLEAEIAELHTLITLKPDDAATHNDLGVCLVKQSKYPDAITAFEKAIALKGGQYPEAINNLGMVFLQIDKHPEAIAKMSVACHQSPSRSFAHHNLDVAVKEKFDMMWVAENAFEYDRMMLQQREARFAHAARFPQHPLQFGPPDRPFGVHGRQPGAPHRFSINQ